MKRLDLETTETSHVGLKGHFEKTLRRFKILTHFFMLIPLYLAACVCFGTCLLPGIFIFRSVMEFVTDQPAIVQNFSYGFSIALGYILYGFSMMFLAPALNFILVGRLREWRGPYYSFESLRWYIHNGLTYLVRYTFLELATPTPMSLLFYKMMGMKIGRGSTINTTKISDPSLIELGEKVTLGGSVTIVGHYGQGGILIIAPVKIGNACTIGLGATIMGGSTIGENAKILPHSVVMPKTIVGSGEIWGGVPAVKIKSSDVPLKVA
jgi:hypothetical protein